MCCFVSIVSYQIIICRYGAGQYITTVEVPARYSNRWFS